MRLCALLLAALSGTEARGSAWNRPAGQGFALIDVTLDQGDRYFDRSGRLAPARSYRSLEGAGYLEYGITDRWMFVGRPSIASRSVGGPEGGRYLGPGATEAGAQYQLLVFGPAVMAVQGSFRLPGTGARLDPASIGNTAREGDLRLLGGVGFSLGSLPAFLDLQGAYRLRSGGAAPEWHGDATFGVSVTPRLLLLLQSFNQLPRGAGTPALPSSAFSKMRVSAVQQISASWAIQLGAFATVTGRDALRERGLVLGLWYRF